MNLQIRAQTSGLFAQDLNTNQVKDPKKDNADKTLFNRIDQLEGHITSRKGFDDTDFKKMDSNTELLSSIINFDRSSLKHVETRNRNPIINAYLSTLVKMHLSMPLILEQIKHFPKHLDAIAFIAEYRVRFLCKDLTLTPKNLHSELTKVKLEVEAQTRDQAARVIQKAFRASRPKPSAFSKALSQLKSSAINTADTVLRCFVACELTFIMLFSRFIVGKEFGR
ncbi:MAG: hypothetical protein S4CHLAM6_08430 [Chlamydiae bacterium]|nr:hypothetical protein [Chlamydiota bacterium]